MLAFIKPVAHTPHKNLMRCQWVLLVHPRRHCVFRKLQSTQSTLVPKCCTGSLQKHQLSCLGHSTQTCSSISRLAAAGCYPGSHIIQPPGSLYPTLSLQSGPILSPLQSTDCLPAQTGSLRVGTPSGYHMSPALSKGLAWPQMDERGEGTMDATHRHSQSYAVSL